MDGSAIDIETSESVAIVVGNSQCPRDADGLPALPGVVANIVDLERLLLDPGVLGLPPERVHRVLDEDSPSRLAELISDWSQSATDTLLFYYAGHGLIAKRGDLLLATSSTTTSKAEVNALRWEQIKDLIRDCPAKKKLVFLDCCFSGRAADLMGPEDQFLKSELEVNGTVVIASSPRNKPSNASHLERRTAFSDAVLGVLETGLDNGREVLSLDEVFTEAKQQLKALGKPEPQRIATAGAHDIAIAHNRRMVSTADSAGLDQVVKRLEARLMTAISKSTGTDILAFLQSDHNEDRAYRPPLGIILFTSFVGLWAVLVEIAVVWSLGSPVADSPYSSDAAWEYPNIVPFSITVGSLMLVSGLVAALAASALRNYDRPTFVRMFLNSRRGIHWLMRLSTVNFAIVLAVAVGSVVLPPVFDEWGL